MQRLFLFGKLSDLNDKDAAIAVFAERGRKTKQRTWKPRSGWSVNGCGANLLAVRTKRWQAGPKSLPGDSSPYLRRLCALVKADTCYHPWNRQNNGDQVTGMALVVFLRGINVGGHRTFRPSVLARGLGGYGVVNVGAAGTFVVRKPGSKAKFRAALLRKLPFKAEVMLCDGRELLDLETDNPFGDELSRPDIVRFVSILSRAGGLRARLPVRFPADGEWFVRVIASKNQFVFGVYRRHMKTIGYLGRIDKLFGVPATTRNWNTILAVARILKRQQNEPTIPLTHRF
jgi:uncharacterized protein (DUF1697 family)